MPAPFFPNESCQTRAESDRTLLALSKVGLFKATFVPTPDTTLADLAAAVVTYTGYAQATITAWLAAIKSAFGGYQISAPTVQFALAATPAVGDSVGGYWIETAGGDLYIVRQFDEPKAMMAAGDGFDINAVVVFPNGTS